jgi:hypothetical protein
LGIQGQQAPAAATIAPLPGNNMLTVINQVVIPRDGWYRFSMDALYQNAAGTQGYVTVFINGVNFISYCTTEPSAALAPFQGITRSVWCKAGDRVSINSGHNEASAVVRNMLGNLYIDELAA